MDEPKEIYAQQLAKNSWGLVVDGETLEERFSTAKEACDFGRQKYGIELKARLKKNSQGSTKKGGAKKLSKNPLKSGDEEPEAPEELPEKNHVAKTHVDGDIRIPSALREQLPLVPGERWKFSIVSVSKTEFTVKAVKVES
ncbi:MAG: hypothetical protein ACFFCW_47395 [Candidatus Hodarchaeota archaeon]